MNPADAAGGQDWGFGSGVAMSGGTVLVGSDHGGELPSFARPSPFPSSLGAHGRPLLSPQARTGSSSEAAELDYVAGGEPPRPPGPGGEPGPRRRRGRGRRASPTKGGGMGLFLANT